jgi:hypothetical protein
VMIADRLVANSRRARQRAAVDIELSAETVAPVGP